MPRKRATELRYKTHRKQNSYNDDACAFCNFTSDLDQIVAETQHFWVSDNIFPYDLWDDHEVARHLLIVPKTPHRIHPYLRCKSESGIYRRYRRIRGRRLLRICSRARQQIKNRPTSAYSSDKTKGRRQASAHTSSETIYSLVSLAVVGRD